MSDVVETCDICCEEYNRTNRKRVTCPLPSCKKSCCRTCYRRNALLGGMEVACMFCNTNHGHDFVSENTPKSFFNKEWLGHCADVFINREKSLLPEAQIEVKRIRDERALIEEHESLTKSIRDAENKFRENVDETLIKPKMLIIQQLQREVSEFRRLSARDNCSEVEQMYVRRHQIVSEIREPTTKEDRKFIQACPKDGCRGFLSQSWKCGVCDAYFCPDCHKQKNGKNDPDHICNDEDKATVALIKADSKPCPNCAQAISKIDGCDQMWCTSCHTAFSWRTGKKISGRIHNPHYMQFQREGGRTARVAGDVQCGGPPHVRILDQWNVIRGYNGFPMIPANVGNMTGWRLFNYARVENLCNRVDRVASREISEHTTKSRTYMAFPVEYPPTIPRNGNDMWDFLGLVHGMIGHSTLNDEIIPLFGVIGKRKYTITDVRSPAYRTAVAAPETQQKQFPNVVPYGSDLLYTAFMSRHPDGIRRHISISFEDEILPLSASDEHVCKNSGLMWAGMDKKSYIGPGVDSIRKDFFTKNLKLSDYDPKDDSRYYSEGKYIAHASRMAHHITDELIPRYQNHTVDETCQALRISYLMGEIEEHTWRQRLKAIAKKSLKNRDMLLILDMAANTITDVLLRFCSYEEMEPATELNSLRDYTNLNLNIISSRFGNIVPRIAADWSTFE